MQLNTLTFTRRTRGFSLLEVLVALLVLSIGLLGLAGMQMVGLRSNNSASFRGQAVAIANDLAERMRANSGVLNDDARDTNGDGIIDASDNINYFANLLSDAVDCSVTPTCGNADTCSPQQMAAYDFNSVVCGGTGVKALLPDGSLTVTCSPAACPDGSLYRITVNWTENGQQASVDLSVVP
jgi:type IV pilus assembly protein PilV